MVSPVVASPRRRSCRPTELPTVKPNHADTVPTPVIHNRQPRLKHRPPINSIHNHRHPGSKRQLGQTDTLSANPRSKPSHFDPAFPYAKTTHPTQRVGRARATCASPHPRLRASIRTVNYHAPPITPATHPDTHPARVLHLRAGWDTLPSHTPCLRAPPIASLAHYVQPSTP